MFCVSHILEAHDFIHWSKLFRCYWPTSPQQWWFGRGITHCRWLLIREVIREMQYFILFPLMSCPIFALQWFAYRHIWQIPNHGIPCVFSIWPIDVPTFLIGARAARRQPRGPDGGRDGAAEAPPQAGLGIADASRISGLDWIMSITWQTKRHKPWNMENVVPMNAIIVWWFMGCFFNLSFMVILGSLLLSLPHSKNWINNGPPCFFLRWGAHCHFSSRLHTYLRGAPILD